MAAQVQLDAGVVAANPAMAENGHDAIPAGHVFVAVLVPVSAVSRTMVAWVALRLRAWRLGHEVRRCA